MPLFDMFFLKKSRFLIISGAKLILFGHYLS